MMAMPRAILEDMDLVRRATRWRAEGTKPGVVVGPGCGGCIERGRGSEVESRRQGSGMDDEEEGRD